jgi:hypothetical protein
MNLFPKLAKRLELQNNTIEACLREAQARRVSSEWSLEGLDCGDNLSSLGMTIMMALIFTGWLGIRVRVFIGLCRSALLGIWNDTNDNFQLLDCTKTIKNSFEICPHFLDCPESGTDICVKKGMIIEVRTAVKWHVAQIIKVRPDLMSAHVQYIGNKREDWISLSSHCWKRLSDENSDSDRVIRYLIKKNDLLKKIDSTECYNDHQYDHLDGNCDDPCVVVEQKRKVSKTV